MDTRTAEQIRKEVRDAYGQIAKRYVGTSSSASCCGPSAARSCCGSAEPADVTNECCSGAAAPASATGECCCSSPKEGSTAARAYAEDELRDLPDTATEVSLGCGNPTALASLQPGEVVLDLGSGGGIDCFLAARKVGPAGRVIGLDMTPEMIMLARRNAKKMGLTNVDFRYGEMEEMPIADESIDVIISNCVINLSPDKDAVFAEACRVLKPGGRMTVSDIVTDGPLPDVLRENFLAWAGCVAGALDESVYLDKMRAAGMGDVQVTQRTIIDVDGFLRSEDVRDMLSRTDLPISAEQLRDQLDGKITSVTVTARKP